MPTAQLSPMMQQYLKIKQQNRDSILFYRLGDFYEMFFDDAKVASKELELVLTGRDCGLEERAPMCGVPYHSAQIYIARLIKKGFKVAICEQMEDPRNVKGIVKRQVVRIVTPGTLIEESMLDDSTNNYIASIFYSPGTIGLAVADISTGHAQVTLLSEDDAQGLKNEILRVRPSEAVFNPPFAQRAKALGLFEEHPCCTGFVEENNDMRSVFDNLKTQFANAAQKVDSLSEQPAAAKALDGLLRYLHRTQQSGVERLISLEVYETKVFMHLDASARRNLELVRTMHNDEKRGSLLWAIDQTKTAMGRRLLRRDLERPLANPIAIEHRFNGVDELKQDNMRRMDLVETLFGMHDIERLFTRIACNGASPREIDRKSVV